MPDQINLGDLSGNKKFALSVESDTLEDAVARRQEKAEEAKHKRRIQFWAFVFSILLLAVIVGCCVNSLASGSPDDKKWAAGVMAAIASAVGSGVSRLGKKANDWDHRDDRDGMTWDV